MEDIVNDEPRRGTPPHQRDDVRPPGLEWDRRVRTQPQPPQLLAAVGGFLLGRSHGPAILRAVSGYAAAEVSKNVSEVLGREIG